MFALVGLFFAASMIGKDLAKGRAGYRKLNELAV